MSIAKAHKCPKHPTTDMVLVGEWRMREHRSDGDEQALAVSACPVCNPELVTATGEYVAGEVPRVD